MSTSILDDMVVRIGGEASSFEGMVGQIESSLMNLAKTAGAAGSLIGAALTVPLGAAGAAMYRSFALIDAQITKALVNIGEQGETARKRLTNSIFEISSKSITSPYALADAYDVLAKSGHDVAESMDYLRRIESFSVATYGDMDKSTRSIVASMRALGLETNDHAKNLQNLNYLTDLYAKASTMSLASAEDLAHTMSGRLPASMKFFNIGLEESLAILTLWTQRGHSASGAGTLLDQMFRHLTDAASRHHKEWKAILGGTDILYDEQGALRPFADSIEILSNNLKNSNPEEARRKMEGLGLNRFIVGGVSNLYDMSAALRKIQTDLKGASGSVDHMKGMRLDDFTSQWVILKNLVSELGYSIGKDLAPAFAELNRILRFLVDGWLSLDPVLRKSVVYFSLFVPGAMAIIAVFSAIVTAVVSLLPLMGAMVIVLGIFFAFMAANGFSVVDTLKEIVEFSKDAYANFLGFMENFQENMLISMKWIEANWSNLWTVDLPELMGRGLKYMLVSFIGAIAAMGEVTKAAIVDVLPDLLTELTAIVLVWAGTMANKLALKMSIELDPRNILRTSEYKEAEYNRRAAKVDGGAGIEAMLKATIENFSNKDFSLPLHKAWDDVIQSTKNMYDSITGGPFKSSLTGIPQFNLNRRDTLPQDLGDFESLRRALVDGTSEGVKEGLKGTIFNPANPVTSPIDFKEINLRRFAIEGPAGLSKEGAEEKNSHAILQTLRDIHQAQIKSRPDDFVGPPALTIADQGGGADF